jgi:hypothetical protein
LRVEQRSTVSRALIPYVIRHLHINHALKRRIVMKNLKRFATVVMLATLSVNPLHAAVTPDPGPVRAKQPDLAPSGLTRTSLDGKIEVMIRNLGAGDAAATVTRVACNGSQDYLDTPPIPAGSSAWIKTTVTPSPGAWMTLVADLYNSVKESGEGLNTQSNNSIIFQLQ